MSNLLFGLGGPAIRFYDTDGTTLLKTLYLPAPDKKGGLVLSWRSLAIVKTRIDGTPVQVFRDSAARYLPVLSVKYSVYDDLLGNISNTIGTADTNTPTVEQLAQLLSTYSGRIRVSPGGTAPFFKCFVSKNLELKPIKNIAYSDLVFEFTGTTAYQDMVLI